MAVKEADGETDATPPLHNIHVNLCCAVFLQLQFALCNNESCSKTWQTCSGLMTVWQKETERLFFFNYYYSTYHSDSWMAGLSVTRVEIQFGFGGFYRII